MVTHITQLIYTESGGFAGLQRGCTIDPHALPPEPFGQLQGLAQQAQAMPGAPSAPSAALQMPDMQVYTLELVSHGEPPELSASHWVLQYPANDVPDEVAELFEFLRQKSAPLSRH
jgi:hypothetical protein